MSILILVTLGPVGGGHTAVARFIIYSELLVPTLTKLILVYTLILLFHWPENLDRLSKL